MCACCVCVCACVCVRGCVRRLARAQFIMFAEDFFTMLVENCLHERAQGTEEDTFPPRLAKCVRGFCAQIVDVAVGKDGSPIGAVPSPFFSKNFRRMVRTSWQRPWRNPFLTAGPFPGKCCKRKVGPGNRRTLLRTQHGGPRADSPPYNCRVAEVVGGNAPKGLYCGFPIATPMCVRIVRQRGLRQYFGHVVGIC